MVKPSLKPSIEEAPKLELKLLLEHLKYTYLGPTKILPVIITSDLNPKQEEELLAILRDNHEAIDWTMADIKGIIPFIVQHRIHLEEEAKLIRDAQKRLNPLMKDVVKKEILKLLNNGIIYPISDSSWINSVQVVPKKSEIIVVQSSRMKRMNLSQQRPKWGGGFV